LGKTELERLFTDHVDNHDEENEKFRNAMDKIKEYHGETVGLS